MKFEQKILELIQAGKAETFKTELEKGVAANKTVLAKLLNDHKPGKPRKNPQDPKWVAIDFARVDGMVYAWMQAKSAGEKAKESSGLASAKVLSKEKSIKAQGINREMMFLAHDSNGKKSFLKAGNQARPWLEILAYKIWEMFPDFAKDKGFSIPKTELIELSEDAKRALGITISEKYFAHQEFADGVMACDFNDGHGAVGFYNNINDRFNLTAQAIMCLFDTLTINVDRHRANWLIRKVTKDGNTTYELIGIDHGKCFVDQRSTYDEITTSRSGLHNCITDKNLELQIEIAIDLKERLTPDVITAMVDECCKPWEGGQGYTINKARVVDNLIKAVAELPKAVQKTARKAGFNLKPLPTRVKYQAEVLA